MSNPNVNEQDVNGPDINSQATNENKNIEETNPDKTQSVQKNTDAVKAKINQWISNVGGEKINKKTKIIAVVAIVFVIAVINIITTNIRIGNVEDMIFELSVSSYENEDQIMKAYKSYNKLSASAKRKVQNRDILIELYKQVEAVNTERKNAAEYVDSLVEAIDYTNEYTKANTVAGAIREYNKLDDKAVEFMKKENELQKAYDEVCDLSVEVTSENFWDFFAIEYQIGEKSNYGEGVSINQSGYTINWEYYYDCYGSDFDTDITPNYDIDAHNDYATPVYVYIAPRYENLASNCSFYIDLHQTYDGLMTGEETEFELQQASIQYDSSQGVGQCCIYVQDNASSSGLLDMFGMSFDFADSIHKMNPFDVSRVQISDVSGYVAY